MVSTYTRNKGVGDTAVAAALAVLQQHPVAPSSNKGMV
jgi:hypothetical protein